MGFPHRRRTNHGNGYGGIIIKNKKCFENIIVISLSNFLRRLFPIDSKKIEGKKITWLKILGLKFKFLNKIEKELI